MCVCLCEYAWVNDSVSLSTGGVECVCVCVAGTAHTRPDDSSWLHCVQKSASFCVGLEKRRGLEEGKSQQAKEMHAVNSDYT